MLLLVGSPIVCAIVGGVRIISGVKPRLGWLAFAVVVSLLSWIVLFLNPGFIPMV